MQFAKSSSAAAAAAGRLRFGYRRRLIGGRRGRLGQHVGADAGDGRLRRAVNARRFLRSEQLAAVLDRLEKGRGGRRQARLERIVAADRGRSRRVTRIGAAGAAGGLAGRSTASAAGGVGRTRGALRRVVRVVVVKLATSGTW